MSVQALQSQLLAVSDPVRAAKQQKFFKTGKGEYAEGDSFLGIPVPIQRKIARDFAGLSLENLHSLLAEDIHEYRLTAIFILVDLYKRNKDESQRREIVDFYLQHLDRINNWDLVDSSAHKILGPYFFDKDKDILFNLARTDHLWSQRVAVISTFYFISKNKYADSLVIAELLLQHEHDLIHKAVGWMLREVGKRSMDTERKFLDAFYKDMPRTMLRYAIEKFPEALRQQYLKGTV